jgi:hypothetical protein
MARRVVVIVDELMVRSRIEAAAGPETTLLFPQTSAEFAAQLEPPPDVILVGTTTTKLPWVQLIREARQRPGGDAISIVAFGPHMDMELRDGALDAGADRVIANSALMNTLPGLLRDAPLPRRGE